ETAREVDKPVDIRQHALATLAECEAGMTADVFQQQRYCHCRGSRVARAVKLGKELQGASDRLEGGVECLGPLPKRVRQRTCSVAEKKKRLVGKGEQRSSQRGVNASRVIRPFD